LKLSKESWILIAESIEENNTITIVSLNAMGLGPKSLEILVPAISKNKIIETLDLSYNYMGDKIASYITKLISN
jgi:Ran GTPase-activating protein (RanGAP) involved in mRNA processing and transport